MSLQHACLTILDRLQASDAARNHHIAPKVLPDVPHKVLQLRQQRRGSLHPLWPALNCRWGRHECLENVRDSRQLGLQASRNSRHFLTFSIHSLTSTLLQEAPRAGRCKARRAAAPRALQQTCKVRTWADHTPKSSYSENSQTEHPPPLLPPGRAPSSPSPIKQRDHSSPDRARCLVPKPNHTHLIRLALVIITRSVKLMPPKQGCSARSDRINMRTAIGGSPTARCG